MTSGIDRRGSKMSFDRSVIVRLVLGLRKTLRIDGVPTTIADYVEPVGVIDIGGDAVWLSEFQIPIAIDGAGGLVATPGTRIVATIEVVELPDDE
jgi:hypothetical protein